MSFEKQEAITRIFPTIFTLGDAAGAWWITESTFRPPTKHSDLFFGMKSHLEIVRGNLGLRRTELQSRMTPDP